MKINQLHDWNLTPSKAHAIQKGLRPWIMLEDQKAEMKDFIRIHISITPDKTVSVRCLHINRIGELLGHSSAAGLAQLPLLDGLASFAITPFIVEALAELDAEPGMIICDGRGIRPDGSFGVASHIGLLTNVPTIGVKAASMKIDPDIHEKVPEMGDWTAFEVGDQVVSGILNAGQRLPLIQVSAGHQVTVASAVTVVAGLMISNADDELMGLLCGPYLRNLEIPEEHLGESLEIAL